MISFAAAFFVSLACSLALERWPPKPPLLRDWRSALIRTLVHTTLFLAAFSLSWRPWHAAFVVAAASFLFGVGDAVKRRILGEPLTFSDFALVRLAIRHPRLYYAERLAEPRAIAIFVTVVVATATWFWIEPSALPPDQPLVVALPPIGALLAALALRSAVVARWADALVGPPVDAARDVDRFGLIGCMAIHWSAWRSRPRPPPEAARAMAAGPTPAAAASGPRVMIAIQCESFLDVAARGEAGPDLPRFRALCDQAVAWGRCAVPADGAYTMRSEFGFLTGVPSSTLGLDGFDPYLTADAYLEASLARRFAAAGRRSLFIHPYDRRFFARDELVPKLGFERFVDEEAFGDAKRVGPYVADESVAEAVLAEARAASEPVFIFVVTIENHGPWGPGRLDETDDGASQYGLHLGGADRMIGRIADELAGFPGGAVLCLYGDHAPARTILSDLEDRGATDYALWDSREIAPARRERIDLDVSALSAEFVKRS